MAVVSLERGVALTRVRGAVFDGVDGTKALVVARVRRAMVDVSFMIECSAV